MHPATKTVLWGAVLAVVTGWTMLNGLRKGSLRASRSYSGRRIYRRENSKLFWTNIVLLGAFCVLGLILAGWALVGPGSFR